MSLLGTIVNGAKDISSIGGAVYVLDRLGWPLLRKLPIPWLRKHELTTRGRTEKMGERVTLLEDEMAALLAGEERQKDLDHPSVTSKP